ncbi:MAG: PLP-dependent aminotransferase family protein [Desulfurococcales archaeon]|nr:PLP-dependent aminotransferase family protein [Desulfurococcales archaeon]
MSLTVKFEKLLAGRSELFRASEVRELLKVTEGGDVISLAGGYPDPRVFPKDDLAEIAKEVISDEASRALQYSPTAGVTEFREELKKFMRRRGVTVRSDDDIIVTTGSQQALDLVARTFVEKDDEIIVELPTYLAALNAFRLSKPGMTAIPLDESGMRTDILESEIKRLKWLGREIKFIYTIPVAHNPTGITMSLERKKELLEIASKYDLVIIEDDPYSYFVYDDGVDITPIKTLDKEGRVVYMSTFSKILAPGLRIGWVLGNEYVTNVLERAKQTADLHTSTLTQIIAMEALRRGVVDKTIDKARQIYRVKRDAMLEALKKYMVEEAWWPNPVGGFFVMVFLPSYDIDTKKMLPEALKKGVAYVPGASFFANGMGWNTMRLNFSYPSPEQIDEGVKRLAGLIQEKLTGEKVRITPISFFKSGGMF